MYKRQVPNDDDDDLVQDDKDDDGALTPEAFLAMAYSKVPTKENGEIAGTSALSATMEDHNDDKDNDDNGDAMQKRWHDNPLDATRTSFTPRSIRTLFYCIGDSRNQRTPRCRVEPECVGAGAC